MDKEQLVIEQNYLKKVLKEIKKQKQNYENVVFALAIKLIVMILGITGHAEMWMAVFADVGAALICVLNAVRLLSAKKAAK